MRRSVLVGVSLLMLGAAVALCAPEQKMTLQLAAWTQTSRFQVFPAGRAVVIASGNGQSPLALYVYDPEGNCVARDDVVEPRSSSDDVAAEWFPPEMGRYTVELRNLGYRTNQIDVVAR